MARPGLTSIAWLLLITAWFPGRIRAADGPPRTGPATESRFPPLKVPAGFKATLFACDPLIEYPSVIAAGPRAGAVFVAIDYVAGLGSPITRRSEVRLVEDTDGDGYADRAPVCAQGFNSIQGLAYRDGTLVIMHAPFLSAVRDADGNGTFEDRRDLLDGLGLPPEKNPSRLHCANGVVVGHDGWLYLALGDNGCDVLRPEGDRLTFRAGGILRCRPDGRDLHVFASGLRNIYDIALDEDLNVFVRDNENDGGEYLIRIAHSFFGADHGYPYLYAERRDEPLAPLAVFGRGSSAGVLCYLEAAFPAEYRGDLFLCEWGRAVMRWRPERSGSRFATAAEVEFASGGENDPYGFKPTDVIAERDGSLIVSDWADGQQPKRGRGRLYRIAATSPRDLSRQTGTGLDAELARLSSDSYAERCDAQALIEHRGADGRAALRTAIAEGRLDPRARLHAVWVLARPGGPAAIDELLELARSDRDPRVQAQAIRAVGDLSDPVLVQHRLAATPGDGATATAAKLAGFAAGRDPRVVLEAIVAVGRLRWPDAPVWLRGTLKEPDASLAHAAVQTMRRSGNWPAVLEILDGGDVMAHTLALRAIADVAEPIVVDGVIARLGSEPSADRRREYADALTRVHRKLGPWVYWGYRPAPRPANPVEWERTAAIVDALNRALADPVQNVRLAVLRRMQREKVPTRLAALRAWLDARPAQDSVAAILESLRDQEPDARRDLLAGIAGDRAATRANRLAALGLWQGGDDEQAQARLLDLAGTLEEGPVLAEAIRQAARKPHRAAAPLLSRALGSSDRDVLIAAVEAAAALRLASADERVRALLAHRDTGVRRAAAEAAGVLTLRTAAEPLLERASDTDPAVRRATLGALALLREPRALPVAVTALADRETRVAALACLAEIGGPAQGNAVAELARQSPSADVLPLALRTLSDWSRRPGCLAAERLALDRAVAEVQGATGLVVRWQVNASRSTSDLAAQPGWPGTPLEPPPGDASAWRTVYAGGTDGRVAIGDPNERACLGVADVIFSEPATVQFLASSNGTLRIWVDDRLVHDRTTVQPFRPESERIDADLTRGAHRLAIEVTSAPRAVEFHVRFRRKGSTAEHERLVQMALARPGDPQRGRKVFEDVNKSLCLNCHRLGDRGETIGPELSGLGRRFSRITIVESILEPSRSIAPSYESVTVALKDGRVQTGVRATESEDSLTLGDREGRRHVIPRADIESIAKQLQSTMPDGLEKRLTPDEFVDLVGFLAGQK